MQFREATARDRDAILALRARCFGDAADPEKLDPRFWDWEFARARVFVGERDGVVLTHVAIVPWGEVPLAVDAMTAPEARGSGAYSGVMAFALARMHGALHAYQIRDAVLGPMLKTGWTVAEKIPVLVRPAGWALTRRPPAEILGRADAAAMAALARSREFIEWRFFDNPRWSYRVTGARDANGRLVAWLVARRTKLKGVDTYAIVDLAGDAAPLIRDAIREAQRLRCTLVAAFVSKTHPARRLLLRRWFVPGPHRFRLLVHGTERTVWPVSWADTDHL